MIILFSHYGLYKKNGWGRTFELAKGLAKMGHKVSLLTSGDSKYPFFYSFEEEGIKIILFNDIIPVNLLSSGYGLLSLFGRIIYCSFFKFDICHSDSHRDNGFIPCIVNRFFYHSKVVVEWWDDFEEKTKKALWKKWYHKILNKQDIKKEITTKKRADGVIPLSLLLYNKAIKKGINNEKMLILNGGCDIDHIKEYDWLIAKQTLGIPSNYITFGLIGMGDSEFDDMKLFYKAIIRSSKSYPIKFINYGRPLVKTIESLPELKNILIEGGWLDYYSDPSKMGATDIFVLAKEDNIINNSGWPTKFGDYLACGRPILANVYGELIPFIENNRPAIIPIDHNQDNITKVINDICQGKYDLKSMGKQNRRVAELNSWDERAMSLNSFYKKLLLKT